MKNLIILESLIFSAYLLFAWTLQKKILPSVSDSWYELRKKGRPWEAIFSLLMFIIGGITFYFSKVVDSEWFEYGGVGLMLVGTAPMFRIKEVARFHVAGAYAAIGFCLWGLLERGIYYPTYIVGVFAILAASFDMKNKTWWIEIVSFYCIINGMMDLCIKENIL